MNYCRKSNYVASFELITVDVAALETNKRHFEDAESLRQRFGVQKGDEVAIFGKTMTETIGTVFTIKHWGVRIYYRIYLNIS